MTIGHFVNLKVKVKVYNRGIPTASGWLILFINKDSKMRTVTKTVLFTMLLAGGMLAGGCGKSRGGYSNGWLYPTNVETVYVEMFENETFRRGLEYELTDAVAKRIESETPYKIISDRDIADSVISGKIVIISDQVLSMERQTGRPLEEQASVTAVVNWKNLKTGQLLVENVRVSEAMSFSEWLDQGFDYGSTVAANRLAERIVEKMQVKW
jgi:hypothetical protein